ncbi:hypothetical protein AB0O67_24515 [Streptomyces sp. NPDC086077]|uniref:hypothetical protein n=1 Tax=Streptomyces sp. NPDC086077 TaxID=3154862 RepID=UPI00341B46FC
MLEEAVEHARRQHTRRRVEEVLGRFRAGRVGTDRPTDAVEGVPAPAEAAREHRIDTLLIRPDGTDLACETWVGGAPDKVAVRRSDVQNLGENDPSPVRADDAPLRAAAVTTADVLIVPPPEGDGADVPAGGLGALLRWAYEPTAVRRRRTASRSKALDVRCVERPSMTLRAAEWLPRC